MEKEQFWSYPNNKQKNWITYRDSIEFKRGLENLENNDSILPISKFIVLAVSLNLKKAGEIDFIKELSTYENIEKILSDLGIYFFRDLDTEKFNLLYNNEDHSGSYIIGSTPDSIGKAIEIMNAKTFNNDYHQKFGESMDFPPTSVSAVLEYNETKNKEFLINRSDERLTDEEKAFLFFRLSTKNWEKEIEWLEQIISAVKEFSPKIYNEVMEQYRRERVKK